jgi:secreted PhoX family phosphatase
MAHPDDDAIHNTSGNPHFQDIIASTLQNPSRRNLIRGGLGLAALSTVPFLAACGGGEEEGGKGLGFDSVGKSLLDEVLLPAGYTYQVLHATGDRLDSSLPPYGNAGLEKDDWSRRIGDHHDGMDIFYIDRKGRYTTQQTDRAVLAVNHESSADAHFFHPRGQTSGGQDGKKFSQFGGWDLGDRPTLEVLKEINHHGISVVELNRKGSGWGYRLDSAYNRRVTAQTPMKISGPAAYLADIHALMVTAYDPTGATSRGTINNCGHGKTPWGTYLGCEENWAFYFQMPKGSAPVDGKLRASRTRYGVAATPIAEAAISAASQGWHTASETDNRFTRWNIAATGASVAEDFRNEPHTFGYNVEIDPLDPKAAPVKRVAMGRFAHESAVCGLPKAGKPLAFYMGCDSRNEYIYKFVSTAQWNPSDEGRGIAAGNKYLDEGRLYVARFNSDGTGEWIELSHKDPRISGYGAYAFANQADVLVNARFAADAVGATKMDRPEWAAVNPRNGEIYFTLTNNSAALRSPATVDAANPRSYEDIDGRRGTGNPNGHIIRFREDKSLSTATRFAWDIFLFGAEEDAGDANLSQLTEKNAFSSPDGLWFSPASGICWIQTDDGAMTDESNCMMLAAIPGEVGDGGPVTARNRVGSATGTQETFMGALLGEARLRRFLVGPKGCEITGVTESPDGKAMFVNIQHPGENTPALGSGSAFTLESAWPANKGYGPAGRPRSATIVITRKDGGVIGGRPLL